MPGAAAAPAATEGSREVQFQVLLQYLLDEYYWTGGRPVLGTDVSTLAPLAVAAVPPEPALADDGSGSCGMATWPFMASTDLSELELGDLDLVSFVDDLLDF
jgi:hypothetical protein